MGQNPVNLAVRFLLELFALFAMGQWGWSQGDGFLRVLWAILIPLVAAVMWGTFRVPDDPGPAPVAVPGAVRLAIEAAVFGFATWALYDSWSVQAAWIFGGVVLVHYTISYDRIAWLVKQRGR